MQITFEYDVYEGLVLPLTKTWVEHIQVIRKSQFTTKKGKTMFSYEVEITGKTKTDKVRCAVLSMKSDFPTSGDVSLRLLSCEGNRGFYQMKYWLS